ncbi:hypothetical protein [Sphingorhabdus sp.]|uniref:hypothetical protein n=1 Tax=Sphingorhabdus sp. TaxID=1902408 RepID=UPI0035943F90
MAEKSNLKRTPANAVHLKLRFTEELRQKLEAAARASNTSMNAYIVEGLERLLQIGEGFDDFPSLALWHELSSIVRRVERVTEAKWQSDRKTFVAVSCMIDAHLKDLQPPYVNEAVLLEVQGKLAQLENKIEGLLGLLQDAGALRPIASEVSGRPISRGLFSPLMLANPSPENLVIIRLLQGLGYEPTLRLDDPVDDWKLGDGDVLNPVAAQSLFQQIPRLANDLHALRKQLNEAFQPNDLAEKEGKRLANSLRQRMTMANDFGEAT